MCLEKIFNRKNYVILLIVVGENMKERYTLRCAVFLILTKIENNKEYILLQRRYQTGILDGQFDVSCSGHLEKDETLKEAMVRETKEEIGITIKQEDLKYSSTIHAKFSDAEYLLIAFHATKYEGIPSIMEQDKCNELTWFDIDSLPYQEIADTRRIMIENYKHGNLYTEYGFKQDE